MIILLNQSLSYFTLFIERYSSIVEGFILKEEDQSHILGPFRHGTAEETGCTNTKYKNIYKSYFWLRRRVSKGGGGALEKSWQ